MEVPPVVREKALQRDGAAWLAELPALVRELATEWSLTIGRVFGDGTEALVLEAGLADGTPAVLKLCVPDPGDWVRHEFTALRLTDGDGCAALLRGDEERGALLLERLGRPLQVVGLQARRRREILCATAARVWRPAAGHGLPTGAEKGRWLADGIPAEWEEAARPCSERAVGHALACAERRIAAHDDERAVLVHGDAHAWNALEAPGGFKLIDPDGLLAEPEYDLGILMREDPVELLAGDPRDRARELAALSGLDEDAIWEWGVVERVSTGLLATSVGMQPTGRQMLAAADRIAERA